MVYLIVFGDSLPLEAVIALWVALYYFVLEIGLLKESLLEFFILFLHGIIRISWLEFKNVFST